MHLSGSTTTIVTTESSASPSYDGGDTDADLDSNLDASTSADASAHTNTDTTVHANAFASAYASANASVLIPPGHARDQIAESIRQKLNLSKNKGAKNKGGGHVDTAALLKGKARSIIDIRVLRLEEKY